MLQHVQLAGRVHPQAAACDLVVPRTIYSYKRGGRARAQHAFQKSAGRALRSAGRGKRMIFAQMAGLLAMPTLLPEGVLSAEGEDAQAVNSS